MKYTFENYKLDYACVGAHDFRLRQCVINVNFAQNDDQTLKLSFSSGCNNADYGMHSPKNCLNTSVACSREENQLEKQLTLSPSHLRIAIEK